MYILIAEDQRVIQMMLESALAEWGFACDIVCNGLEALEQARANPGRYDLCIMDVSMPVMDGIEATRLLREEVGYFPILGYCSDLTMRRPCLAAGMDRFLLKPCSRERLFKVIMGLCGGGGGVTHAP